MQTYCKVLFLATIWILCGTKFIFCTEPTEFVIEARALGMSQDGYITIRLPRLSSSGDRFSSSFKAQRESKELPIEDRRPGMYADDTNNGIRYYRHLVAHGDYARLKLIIRSDKKDYGPDEPVNIKFFVRNDSDSEVHIRDSFFGPFFYLWKLFHSNYDEVIKTSKGEEQVQRRKKLSWPKEDRHFFDQEDKIYSNFDYLKLQPGQEYELDCSLVRLNTYFDLTKPDVYELTCFQPTVIAFQYYEPPLQSNTLTFRILEADEKAEVTEADMNPPKGEEVFKQPKPPKNVFYVPGYGELNVSPTTFSRQRVEERKAQKLQER